MRPSLKYIYHKLRQVEPLARLVDEDAWKFQFEWVSMAGSDAVGRSGFLYLVDADIEIAQPPSGDAAFACVLAQRRSGRFAGVPRIVVPDSCDMSIVFNSVVDEVDRFRHWDEAVSQILLGGASLQEVLEATYALVPRPMYFADAYWRMVARIDSGMDEMSSHWLHEIRHGCLSVGIIEKLNKSGEYRRVADANRAFLVETESFNLNYIAKSLKYRGKLLGFFFIIDVWEDLGPCEIELAEKLGRLLAPLLDAGREGMLGEDARSRGLAALLESGKVDTRQLASALAATTAWSMDGDWHLAAVRISDSERSSPIARMRIEGLLGSSFDSCVIPAEGVSFVAFRNAGECHDDLKRHLQESAMELGRTVLFSGRFSQFQTAALYYRQFKMLLEDDRAFGLAGSAGEPSLVSYESLLPSLLAHWCQHKLPPSYEVDALEAHDKAHGTDYMHTLYAYLLNERNTVATARALYLHRNSMHNRLEKILSLIDVDLEDGAQRFSLLLSLGNRLASNDRDEMPATTLG